MAKLNIEERIERFCDSVPTLANPTAKKVLVIAAAVLLVVFFIAVLFLGAFLLSKVPWLVSEDVQDCVDWLWIVFWGIWLFVCRPFQKKLGKYRVFRFFSSVVYVISFVAFFVRGAGLFAG